VENYLKEETKMKRNQHLTLLIALMVVALVTASCAAPTPTRPAPTPTEAPPCLIVGMLVGGSIADAGYNQAQYEGLQTIKKNLPCVKTIWAENVPDADAERVMENMVQQGAKLIFPAGSPFQDPALKVAEKYPNVTFMHPGGWKLAKNFGTYFGTTQFHWYLMGVAAGKMTKTNKIGFVAGMPLGFALGNINGFHLGARSVNPKVETRVVFTGAWLDRAKEAAATNALIDQGVDVVGMHVDSPVTVVQTAESRGAYSIGFQSNAVQPFAPKSWITGLGFTWGGLMTDAAKQVMAGTWQSAHLRAGVAEGYMAIAPFGPAVPKDVQDLVLSLAKDLGTGKLKPFTGPIKDQDGNIRIKEGEVWGNEKMGSFDWFVEGIIGKPK
jgi:basic membrane protein A